jgi:hypothetical protein
MPPVSEECCYGGEPTDRKMRSWIRPKSNELLHSLKAKLAEKNYDWHTSSLVKCSIAVLNCNESYSWKLEVCDDLGFPPLSSKLLDFLKKEAEDQKARKKLCATALDKAVTMRRRRIYKESIQASDKRAAKNKGSIHVQLPSMKKKMMNRNSARLIADRHHIIHTHNN